MQREACCGCKSLNALPRLRNGAGVPGGQRNLREENIVNEPNARLDAIRKFTHSV